MSGIVKVIDVKDGGFFDNGLVYGSLDNVVLEKDGEFMMCEGILIWEDYDEEELSYIWSSWKDCFDNGEEGYFKFINGVWVENCKVV
jgi:hypothetical protein